MSKNILVISHSGKEDFNELITKLILLKVTNELNLEKCYNNIYTTTIHEEK
jgi:hypothetical protein